MIIRDIKLDAVCRATGLSPKEASALLTQHYDDLDRALTAYSNGWNWTCETDVSSDSSQHETEHARAITTGTCKQFVEHQTFGLNDYASDAGALNCGRGVHNGGVHNRGGPRKPLLSGRAHLQGSASATHRASSAARGTNDRIYVHRGGSESTVPTFGHTPTFADKATRTPPAPPPRVVRDGSRIPTGLAVKGVTEQGRRTSTLSCGSEPCGRTVSNPGDVSAGGGGGRRTPSSSSSSARDADADWLLTMSKFRHVCNVGTRPFRFYMRPNLSVYVSHIINVKLNNLYSVEIGIDDKLAYRSGWYDSTMFRCTFEFDKFHPLRSFIRITLWQKHKFREDTVEGECLLTLGELDCLDPSLLPAQFPMEVRYKKITSRNMLRDKVNGPRVFCDMMLTIPRISAMASEKGTQTNIEEECPQSAGPCLDPYPSLLLGDVPVSTGSLSSVESEQKKLVSARGFNSRMPHKQTQDGPRQAASQAASQGQTSASNPTGQSSRQTSVERSKPPKARQWPPWPDESDSDFSRDS